MNSLPTLFDTLYTLASSWIVQFQYYCLFLSEWCMSLRSNFDTTVLLVIESLLNYLIFQTRFGLPSLDSMYVLFCSKLLHKTHQIYKWSLLLAYYHINGFEIEKKMYKVCNCFKKTRLEIWVISRWDFRSFSRSFKRVYYSNRTGL